MRKKILAALFAALVWTYTALPVRAANGVHMSFSDPTAHVGEEVTVVLMATKEGGNEVISLSSVELELSYDASLLKFEKCMGGMGNLRAEGENGRLTLSDRPERGASPFLAELHFTALDAGNSEVRIIRSAVRDAAGGEPSCTFGSSAVSVNVKTEQDVSLYALSFNVGELTPAFEPERTLYHLTVPMETTFVTVAARPSNYWATHYVDGHGSLQPGENTVTITVTSGDGTAQQVYTVLVYRGTPPISTAGSVEVPTAALPEESGSQYVPEPAISAPGSDPAPELPAEEREPETGADEGDVAPEKSAADTAESRTALLEQALQTKEERLATLERAAKITTVAAMAELVIIVVLGCCLWNAKRQEYGRDDKKGAEKNDK